MPRARPINHAPRTWLTVNVVLSTRCPLARSFHHADNQGLPKPSYLIASSITLTEFGLGICARAAPLFAAQACSLLLSFNCAPVATQQGSAEGCVQGCGRADMEARTTARRGFEQHLLYRSRVVRLSTRSAAPCGGWCGDAVAGCEVNLTARRAVSTTNGTAARGPAPQRAPAGHPRPPALRRFAERGHKLRQRPRRHGAT